MTHNKATFFTLTPPALNTKTSTILVLSCSKHHPPTQPLCSNPAMTLSAAGLPNKPSCSTCLVYRDVAVVEGSCAALVVGQLTVPLHPLRANHIEIVFCNIVLLLL